jgi:hypothetical protein
MLTLTGMVMAVKLVSNPASKSVLILSGYEGGLTAVHELPLIEAPSVQSAQLVYLSQPHTQPILSLDVAPGARTYFTSSADAIIAAHRIPELPCDAENEDGVDVHAGPTHGNGTISATTSTLVAGNTGHVGALATTQSTKITQSSNLPSQPATTTSIPSLSFSKQPLPTPKSSSPKIQHQTHPYSTTTNNHPATPRNHQHQTLWPTIPPRPLRRPHICNRRLGHPHSHIQQQNTQRSCGATVAQGRRVCCGFR